jgi:hypothetical protein
MIDPAMEFATHQSVVLEMPKISKAWLRRAYDFDAEELAAAAEVFAGPAASDTCAQLQVSLASDAEPVEWWPEAA